MHDARHWKNLDEPTDSPVIFSCAFHRMEGFVRVSWRSAGNEQSLYTRCYDRRSSSTQRLARCCPIFGHENRRSPGGAASRTGSCPLAEQRGTLRVGRSLPPPWREAFRRPHSRWVPDLPVPRLELRCLRAMRADSRASLTASTNACVYYRVSRHGKIWSDLGVPWRTKERSTPLPRMG